MFTQLQTSTLQLHSGGARAAVALSENYESSGVTNAASEGFVIQSRKSCQCNRKGVGHHQLYQCCTGRLRCWKNHCKGNGAGAVNCFPCTTNLLVSVLCEGDTYEVAT